MHGRVLRVQPAFVTECVSRGALQALALALSIAALPVARTHVAGALQMLVAHCPENGAPTQPTRPRAPPPPPPHTHRVTARRLPPAGLAAARAGAVAGLVAMLSRCMCDARGGGPRCLPAPALCRGDAEREAAAGAVCNLLVASRSVQAVAVRAGCVPRLTALLVCGTPLAAEAAASALCALSRSPQYRDDIVAAAGVDRLAALLVSGTARAKAAATRALAPLQKPAEHACLRASGLSGRFGEVRLPPAMELRALGVGPAPGVARRKLEAAQAARAASARGLRE